MSVAQSEKMCQAVIHCWDQQMCPLNCHCGWCHILNVWLFHKQRLFKSVKVTFGALNILLPKTKVYSIHTTESSPSSISRRRLAGFQESRLNIKERKTRHYQNLLSMWKQRWLNSQWRGRRSAGSSPRHSCWPRDSGGPSYGCSAYRYCRRRRKHPTSVTSWLHSKPSAASMMSFTDEGITARDDNKEKHVGSFVFMYETFPQWEVILSC